MILGAKHFLCGLAAIGSLIAPAVPYTHAPDPDEVEMLAIIIYQEAGDDGCCDECRKRVADVVLNRIADPRYPDTMSGVITQRAQYGRLYWTGIKWPERAKNAVEAEAVQRARDTAWAVLTGDHSELYGAGYVYQSEHKQSDDGMYHCGHWFCR